ncbi:MAG: hypothetical protein AAGJ35_01300, partial [Myxococcota bacterium]
MPQPSTFQEAPSLQIYSAWILALTVPCVILFVAPMTFTRYSTPKEAIAWVGMLLVIGLEAHSSSRNRLFWRLSTLFLVWGGCSLAWSRDPQRGALALHQCTFAVLWCACCVRQVKSLHLSSPQSLCSSLQQVGCLWMWSGVTSGLVGLWQAINTRGLSVYQVTGTIGNPNRLGGILLLCLPMAWWLWFAPSSKRIRGLGILGGVCCVLSLLATRCQSALLCTCLVLLMLWIQHWFSHMRPLTQSLQKTKVIVRMLGTLLIIGLWLQLLGSHSPLRAALQNSLKGRLWIAERSLETLEGQWLFGLGWGSYPQAIAWAQGNVLQRQAQPWTLLLDPHNQWLDIFCALGVVGVLLVFAILIVLGYELFHAQQHPSTQAALSALCGAMLYACSETPRLSVGFVMLCAGWVAVALSPIKQRTTSEEDPPKKPRAESQRLHLQKPVRFAETRWLLRFVVVGVGCWLALRSVYSDFRFGQGLRAASTGTADG